MLVITQALVSGLFLGLLYAALASGFALVYSVGRTFNLAHGEFVILGGYVGFWLTELVGLHPLLTLPVAAVVGGLAGVGLNWLTARVDEPFELNALVLSFGVALTMQSAMLNLWGADYRLLSADVFTRTLRWGPVTLGMGRVIAGGVALLLLVLLGFLLYRTYIGKAMRATSQDRMGADLVGIHVNQVDVLIFALGGALAAGVGPLYALLRYVDPSAGLDVTLIALTLTVLGGVGRLRGLLLSGIALGLIESLVVGLAGLQWRELVLFSVLLILLRVQANGRAMA